MRASSAGDYLRLSVRDHGPGIAAELQEQLGEPFFRAPNQSSPGHGLGLAIARRAIERHGGHLRLATIPTAASSPPSACRYGARRPNDAAPR